MKSPKIIALLTFKNESWVLQEYINAIKKITNHMVVYDNGSTDNSVQILKDAGALFAEKSTKITEGYQEYELRKLLLEEGRKHGGTHFICIDADEVFSDVFYTHAKETILSLRPGQSLWMDWVTLYQNEFTERVDGVYKKISKNFIFCDREDLAFSYVFLGVSRTPGDLKDRVVLDRSKGSVIHYQYLNTKRSDMKRVWYMCYEHTKHQRSPIRINTTYEIQKERKGIPVKQLTKDTSYTIIDRSILAYEPKKDWRFQQILEWFTVYGVEFFEPLDIWNTKEFMEIFLEKTGRPPKPKKLPAFLLQLNNLKNKIVVLYSLLQVRKKKIND